MRASFELFDHTADLGLRIRAGTLPDLLWPATQALYTAIGELVPGAVAESLTIDMQDSGAAELLREYLSELLVLFEHDQRIVTGVQVERFDAERLVARCETVLVDEDRSAYYREVKAITYHELDIRAIPGGYEATLIVDI